MPTQMNFQHMLSHKEDSYQKTHMFYNSIGSHCEKIRSDLLMCMGFFSCRMIKMFQYFCGGDSCTTPYNAMVYTLSG